LRLRLSFHCNHRFLHLLHFLLQQYFCLKLMCS